MTKKPEKKAEGGYGIYIAVIIYLIFSLAWAGYNLFQPDVSLFPSLNLVFALFVIAITVICSLLNSIPSLLRGVSSLLKDYKNLKEEDRKIVDKAGKKIGKTIFLFLKDRPNWLGQFLKKYEEA